MPRVASPLIADDDIKAFGQKIHHPAFSLVAPVDAYHRTVAHFAASIFCSSLAMISR